MFLRVSAIAAIAGLSVLAACSSGQQTSQARSGVVPSERGVQMPILPAKDCGGSGGVKVTPCPVRLSKLTKRGIVVTVSGPGVVNSYLGRINGCFNGQLCYYAERRGGSQVQWRITSGQACGNADVEFDAVDAGGSQVGYFFLKVSNKYCP